jgi:tRNA splicing endonuclease
MLRKSKKYGLWTIYWGNVMKYGSHDYKYSITYLVYHSHCLPLVVSSKRKITVMSTIVRCM